MPSSMKLELPVYFPEHILNGAPVHDCATAFIDQTMAWRLIEIAAGVIGTGAEISCLDNTAPFKWHTKKLFEDGVLAAEGCDYEVLKIDLAVDVYIRVGKTGFCFATDVPAVGTFLTQQIDFLQLSNHFGIKLPWINEMKSEVLDPGQVYSLVTDIVEACTTGIDVEASLYKDLLFTLMSAANVATLQEVLKKVEGAEGAPLDFAEQPGLRDSLRQLIQAVA